MAIKPEFDETICDKILIELDGWRLAVNEDLEENEEPFLDIEDPETLQNIDDNHRIGIGEVQHFYDEAYNDALTDSNRDNTVDLSPILFEMFLQQVHKLAASKLWNKYNTQVNNDNMEGAYVVSQGGRLYKDYKDKIKEFKPVTMVGLSSVG